MVKQMLQRGERMIDTDKYENMRQLFLDFIDIGEDEPQWKRNLEIYDDLLTEVKRLREDYEKMSEVLREHGMDICRHCRVIYCDDDMNHPHYPSLHPWHMDGMCMKEMIE